MPIYKKVHFFVNASLPLWRNQDSYCQLKCPPTNLLLLVSKLHCPLPLGTFSEHNNPKQQRNDIPNRDPPLVRTGAATRRFLHGYILVLHNNQKTSAVHPPTPPVLCNQNADDPHMSAPPNEPPPHKSQANPTSSPPDKSRSSTTNRPQSNTSP